MLPENNGQIMKVLKSLKKNKFDSRFVANGKDARQLTLDLIPDNASVGIGDSTTLRQLRVLEKLSERGTKVINPFVKNLTEDPEKYPRHLKLMRESHRCDFFMTSANAVTVDGKIISVDRAGNRVAGMIFGAPRVILTIGRNKIVDSVDEAMERIRNIIAPTHQKRKDKKTPCIKTGKCEDCNAPERGCNITVILEKRPLLTDLTIILVDEDLGLAWDPSWPQKRIKSIKDDYYDNTWVFKGMQNRCQ